MSLHLYGFPRSEEGIRIAAWSAIGSAWTHRVRVNFACNAGTGRPKDRCGAIVIESGRHTLLELFTFDEEPAFEERPHGFMLDGREFRCSGKWAYWPATWVYDSTTMLRADALSLVAHAMHSGLFSVEFYDRESAFSRLAEAMELREGRRATLIDMTGAEVSP